MQEIDGHWIMNGISWRQKGCLHSVEELSALIDEVGFLPLFSCEIPGFSVEEHTDPAYWWSERPERDPWYWRTIIAREGRIAYGKFFEKKAGFVSKKWFPYFANLRRDGYDFDALWDDGKAGMRQKKIMDCFDEKTRLFSFELKEKAGFGKGGEKGFEGTLANLQMQSYLCMRDFEKRKNKQGKEYGWDVAIYAMPEQIFGYKHVTKAYGESPEVSYNRIANQLRKVYGDVDEKVLKRIVRG